MKNSAEQPEQLLDVFKAAALSVTKLYRTSAALETKARSDGYQECLDELLSFLDKAKMGLGDGEGWRIRGWATERLDGRDTSGQVIESDEDIERTDAASSPEMTNAVPEPQAIPLSKPDNSTTTVMAIPDPPTRFIVPTQDTFNFQSSHPYPNIATLDLSDARSQEAVAAAAATIGPSKPSKPRAHGGSGRTNLRSNPLGRGAGSKRKVDFNELFPGCFSGKDPFGGGGKRGRHV